MRRVATGTCTCTGTGSNRQTSSGNQAGAHPGHPTARPSGGAHTPGCDAVESPYRHDGKASDSGSGRRGPNNFKLLRPCPRDRPSPCSSSSSAGTSFTCRPSCSGTRGVSAPSSHLPVLPQQSGLQETTGSLTWWGRPACACRATGASATCSLGAEPQATVASIMPSFLSARAVKRADAGTVSRV
jgi:hypothetical protein